MSIERLTLSTIMLLFLVCATTRVIGNDGDRRGVMSITEGCRYMVAFPQVWASPSETPLQKSMMLLVSSPTKTKVRVKTPAVMNDGPPMDAEYTIEANRVGMIPISVAYMNKLSETKRGYGIAVEAPSPISVFTLQQWNGNGEVARHLPVEAWGSTYYTMNFYQDRYGTQAAGYDYRPSQIVIVAANDLPPS